MTESELRERFRARGIVEEDELFLPPAAAKELVAAAKTGELAPIAVEGFARIAESFEPMPDLFVDLVATPGETWEGYRDACAERALEALGRLERGGAGWANVLLFSRGEWEKLRARR